MNIDTLATALDDSIFSEWEDLYDFVNPFGDDRGYDYASVWALDLDRDMLFFLNNDTHQSVSLGLARQRPITLVDFGTLDMPPLSRHRGSIIGPPSWEPALDSMPRERAFLGRVLNDFATVWSHVIRRDMNTATLLRLGYAIIWIARNEFDLHERTGFERVTRNRGVYVNALRLPGWDTPDARVVQAGSAWFVLSHDIRHGLEMVRQHMRDHSTMTRPTVYAVLTIDQVMVCRACGDELVWSRPERLFDGTSPASDAAIDLLLGVAWMGHQRRPTSLINLPVEIQDRILYFAAGSLVASAKLRCQLDLGSPFSWMDEGVEIKIETVHRHRVEFSPVESQVALNGSKSGLSYKRAHGYGTIAYPLPMDMINA